MSDYVRVNANNIVTYVTPMPDEMTENEAIDHLYKTIPDSLNDRWIKSNNPKSLGIGYEWREDLNGFVGPKPYESWTLDESTCEWKAPVAKPSNIEGIFFDWNEDIRSWVPIYQDVLPTS